MRNRKTKKAVVKKSKVQDRAMPLAHAGTKETLSKLEAIVANEQDGNKRDMAELALDKCRISYYEPTNEKEEADFYLLKLIRQKDNRLDDRYVQLSGLECEVKFAEQEFRVAKAIAENIGKEEKEDKEIGVWATQDLLTMAQQRLEEIQNWIKDDEEFIETAKSLITTERYKNMPEDYMDRVHFDNETLEDLSEESGDCDCPDCCADCCDCCGDDFDDLASGEDDKLKF